MQRLPAELHGAIFVACLPNDPYVRPTGNQAPLLLVRVCRRWSAVALRTPQLWRSLDAVQDLGFEGLDTVRQEQMDLYSSWLSRSGNLPLSLGISFCEHLWLRDEWLQAIQCYLERCQRLRVVDGAGMDLDLLLSGTRMLRHLAIEARSQEVDLAAVQPRPSLRTLVLDLFHPPPATFLQAQWDNLTRLVVRLPDHVSYEGDEFLRLLDRCPNLERLVFGPVAVSNHHRPPRSYPNLRELCIISDVSEAHDDPLSVLIFPGLLLLRVLYRLEGDLEDVLSSDEELEPLALDGPGLPERMCSIQAKGEDRWFAVCDLCWTNVTHLNIEVGGSTGVLDIVLMACPNVQVLYLYGRHCTPRCTSLPVPIRHPTLSDLSITVWADFGNFLFEATLPGLRELSIIAASYGQPEDIREFLVRSGCPLEGLRVRARGSRVWTEDEEAELMGLIPTLTRLELDT